MRNPARFLLNRTRRGLWLGLLGLFVAGLASSGKAEETAPKMEVWKNSIGMEFVKIPAGSFLMGASESDKEADDDERPQHKVTLSQPFYLGKYPVTQREWLAVMGKIPGQFKGDDYPVENVSWDDAQEFIRRLNQKEGTDKYRLPTEAEWEYAARAGTNTVYSFGDDPSELGRYAWYKDNSHMETHPVGEKLPNPWGLHDMYGNVYEWIEDWYDKNYYAKSPARDPQGPSTALNRVLRGASWLDSAWGLRSAFRYILMPDFWSGTIGFRLARSLGNSAKVSERHSCLSLQIFWEEFASPPKNFAETPTFTFRSGYGFTSALNAKGRGFKPKLVLR